MKTAEQILNDNSYFRSDPELDFDSLIKVVDEAIKIGFTSSVIHTSGMKWVMINGDNYPTEDKSYFVLLEGNLRDIAYLNDDCKFPKNVIAYLDESNQGERVFTLDEALDIYKSGFQAGSLEEWDEVNEVFRNNYFKQVYKIEI